MNNSSVRLRLGVVALCLVAEVASAGVVDLVSRAATLDETAAGYSTSASLSADARYVAFASVAPNIVPGVADDNGASDIFLFDRVAGSTLLVTASAVAAGHTANAASTEPVVSADGRFVLYKSLATDLVAGEVDSNGKTDIFLFDRVTGGTTLISHGAGSPAQTGNAESINASMSADGRLVVFESTSTDLFVPPPPAPSVYLWDRTTGSLSLVTHVPGSAVTGVAGWSPVIARDGSTVVFYSIALGVVPGQTVNQGSLYAFDRATGTITLVSHAAGSSSASGNASSWAPSLSADGRFVAFRSGSTNLVPGQVGGGWPFENVFLHDRALDATIVVSRKAGSPTSVGNGFSYPSFISADGRFVAFMNSSTDLVPGFTSGNGGDFDLYLFDRVAATVSLINGHNGSPTVGSNGKCFLESVSADGRWVVYDSKATDILAGQTGSSQTNSFVYDRLLGASRLVSHAAGSPLAQANASSGAYGMSADGAFAVFFSFATDIVPGLIDQNGTSEAFLYDLQTDTSSLVTRRAPDQPNLSPDDYSTLYSCQDPVSDDGRFVAFLSQGTNLVAGQVDANATRDVFLFDRLSRSTALVSHAATSPSTAGNGECAQASVSADGRWVAFSSKASDLVSGLADAGGRWDVFLYDRTTGTNLLVSRSTGTASPASGDSGAPVLSRDGRFVVFVSTATDLVASQTDTNLAYDVFLFDRLSGTTILVSHVPGSPTTTGNGYAGSAAISQDGSFVAFASGATNLAAGGAGAFLFERATGTVSFVGPVDASLGDALALSDGGNWVAFTSTKSNVVPGMVQIASRNVFLFDRAAGITTLASRRAGTTLTSGDGSSVQPSLSADGRFLAFASDAKDLTGVADTNGKRDVLVFDRTDGSVRLVSAAAGGAVAANGGSSGPAISRDGSRIAFISNATNLVPGQDPGTTSFNVYLYSIAQGTSLLASGAFGSAVKGGDDDAYPTEQPACMSASGDVVAFQSYATNLVRGDYNRTADVFAFSTRYEGAAAFFNTVVPCRLADTRGAPGPWGAPALAANSSRTFALTLRCAIPSDAVAVSANVTVVNPAAAGELRFYPAGFSAGGTSTASFATGQVRANNAILALGAGGATAVDAVTAGSVDLVIDVNGYFR